MTATRTFESASRGVLLSFSPFVYTSGRTSLESLQPTALRQRTVMLTRCVLAASPVSVKPFVEIGFDMHHLLWRRTCVLSSDVVRRHIIAD